MDFEVFRQIRKNIFPRNLSFNLLSMNTNLRKINQLIYHLSNILSNAVAV